MEPLSLIRFRALVAVVITATPAWRSCEHAQQRFRVRVQAPIDLGMESQPQPDLVLCRLQRYSDRHPAPADIYLVVEVADTTLAFDLGQKRALYSGAGIDEYWVIDVQAKKLTRFVLEGKELVESPVSSSKISPTAFRDASIGLEGLFC